MPFTFFEPEHKLIQDEEKFRETNDAVNGVIERLSKNKLAYKTTKNPRVEWHLDLMRQALRELHAADVDVRGLGDEILRRGGFVTHDEIKRLLSPSKKLTSRERLRKTDEIVSALRAVHEDQLELFKRLKPAEYGYFLRGVYARIGRVLPSVTAKPVERGRLDRKIKDNFPLFLYLLGFRVPTGVPPELWGQRETPETAAIRARFLKGISAGKGAFSDEKIRAAIAAIEAEARRKEEMRREMEGK